MVILKPRKKTLESVPFSSLAAQHKKENEEISSTHPSCLAVFTSVTLMSLTYQAI